MNENFDTNSNYQLPKEDILEEIRKKAYNSAPTKEDKIGLAINPDMKYARDNVLKWKDFIIKIADIFYKNSPFGMISTHMSLFKLNEYNPHEITLINAVFCFLADNYGRCSEDNYKRLIKVPELALQNSKNNISHYKFISVLRDNVNNNDCCRKFDIAIKQYNLLSKTIDILSPVGYYHIDEQRFELDFHLSKLYVDIIDIDKILNAIKDLCINKKDERG